MSHTSNSSPLTIVGDGDPISKLYIVLNFIIFIPSPYAMCLLHVKQIFFAKLQLNLAILAMVMDIYNQ
jgi:hypothetical protein